MKISDEIPFFHVKFPHKMKLKIKTFLVKWVPFWRHFNLKKTFLFEFFCSFRVKQRVVSMYLTVFWETRRLNLRSKWVNKKLVKFYKGKFFIMKKMRIWFFNFVWVFSRNLAQMRLKCQCFFFRPLGRKKFFRPKPPQGKVLLAAQTDPRIISSLPLPTHKNPWGGTLGRILGFLGRHPFRPKGRLKKNTECGGKSGFLAPFKAGFFSAKATCPTFTETDVYLFEMFLLSPKLSKKPTLQCF